MRKLTNLISRDGKSWFVFLVFLLLVSTAYASAGGGGGGSSGGHDDDGGGLFLIIYYIFRLIPFPYNFIVLAVVIVLFYLMRKKVRSNSGLNQVPSFASIDHQQSVIPADFLQRNPQFDEAAFKAKVNTAFFEIQDAWMQQDLSKVRKWISDGVWQRFNTQFVMMQALGQRNTMSDIHIQSLVIDNVQRDGNYDIIDVGIHFTMQDNFVTDRFPQLNQEGFLENVEYWTFIRKTGVQERDMFHSQNCPNCGGQLPEKMGEISRCEHCGSITTLGDYDWVLSEITQSNDYVNENRKLEKEGPLTGRIRQAMSSDADFCVQLMEDKASNAYMQIMSAVVVKKPERMRRFADNALFDRFTERIRTEAPFVFNRLYLNNVTLMDFYQAEGKDNLVIAFRRTSQRVNIASGQLQIIDMIPYATNEVMIMSRDTGAAKAKGFLYAHSCPNCGGPVGDTLDLTCGYCGAELNSTKHEWIITQLMGHQEYQSLVQARHYAMTTGAGSGDLDPLYKVRDYAFNNVMLIAFADGRIAPEELEHINHLAKKLGYDTQKLAGLFELAKNRQLTIRLPENKDEAQKVYKAMHKAAMADGNIDPAEQAILDNVEQHIAQMN